jgi:glycosyltransferase involved in cell wall biosynthesis
VAVLEATGAAVAICPSPVLRKSILKPKGFASFSAQVAMGTAGGLRLMRNCRPDVVYVNTVTIPLWSVLAKLFRKPILTHVHEAEGSAPRILKILLSAPLLLSTSIVANSAYSASVLAGAVRGLSSRTVVVYNGVPGPDHPEAPRTVITPSIRLLYIGRLSSRKGVDVAVSALGHIKQRGLDASLDIVGAVFPGYEWYEADVRELVARLGLQDVVTFHGFTPNVWPHIARADVVLVPSRLDEPFGNTAVEAVLAGRPVIVSDTSGLREAAGSYASAQLVPPGDAQALAEAVERVVGDWASYRDHAQVDAGKAFTKHSSESYGARIRAELKAVLAQPGRFRAASHPSAAKPGAGRWL